MFTTLKVTASHPAGSVVSFDATEQAWALAQDSTQLVGVVNGDTFEHEGALYAPITFGGVAFALTARDIDRNGGGIVIENGKVYVGPLVEGRAGEVAPIAFDQPAPLAGERALVFLR